MFTVQRDQLTFLLLPSFTGAEHFTGAALVTPSAVPLDHPGVYGVTVYDDDVVVHPVHTRPPQDLVHLGAQLTAQRTFMPGEQPALHAYRGAYPTGTWRLHPDSMLYVKGPVLHGQLDDVQVQCSVHGDALHLKLQAAGGTLTGTLRRHAVELPTYTRPDGSALPRSSTRISAHLDQVAAKIAAHRSDPDSPLGQLLTQVQTLHAHVTHHRARTEHAHLDTALKNMHVFLRATPPQPPT